MVPTVPTHSEYIQAQVKAYSSESLTTALTDHNAQVKAYLDDHPQEIYNPDREAVARKVFLSLYDGEVELHNARKAFLEVLALPSHADIAEYSRLVCATRWKMVSSDEFVRSAGE